MTIWKRVRYSGRVQGVGFRYTAQRLASEYSVEGYVRNLPTGDVELLAGGDERIIRAFLAAVAHRMAGYIDDQIHVRDELVRQITSYIVSVYYEMDPANRTQATA